MGEGAREAGGREEDRVTDLAPVFFSSPFSKILGPRDALEMWQAEATKNGLAYELVLADPGDPGVYALVLRESFSVPEHLDP